MPLRADEEVLRVRLENALEQLRNPAHFRGKITELWAQLQILKDSKRLHPAGNYEVSDEAQLEGISKVTKSTDRPRIFYFQARCFYTDPFLFPG